MAVLATLACLLAAMFVVCCGLLAAFAGILYTGHYGSVAATQGNGWIFQVFAAAVIVSTIGSGVTLRRFLKV